MTQREMFEASFMRPYNYFELHGIEQWDIDKALGILDWTGEGHNGPMTPEERARFEAHYSDFTNFHKQIPKIQKAELYCFKGLDEDNLRVWAGRISKSDFDRVESGGNPYMETGWKIMSECFFSRSGGQGFAIFHAIRGADVVFGDYCDGIYSSSKEALEKFINDHPPFNIED